MAEIVVALDAYALMRLKEYLIIREGLRAGFEETAKPDSEVKAMQVFYEFGAESAAVTLDLITHLQHLYDTAPLEPEKVVLTLSVFYRDGDDWTFAATQRHRKWSGYRQPDDSWTLLHASRFCSNLMVAYNRHLEKTPL